MLDAISKAMFVETVNTRYQLQLSPTQQIELELIDVREGRSSPRQEQFALLFRGPLESFLGQGQWTLHQSTLGTLDLFLVPVGRDALGFEYEAVFNRVVTVTT